MSGQFYDNPQRTVHHIDAAAIAGGGDLATIVGPEGKVGRVRRLDVVTTTAFTIADDALTLDTITPSLASPPTLTLPFSGSAGGDVTRATKSALQGFSDLPADSPVQLAAAGTATAGAGSIELEIDWY